MKTLSEKDVIYEMSMKNRPRLFVKPREPFLLFTNDCYSGRVQSRSQFFSKEDWPVVNPATGPVFVERASPGDVLAVKILEIKTGSKGVMCIEPGAGALANFVRKKQTRILRIRNGFIELGRNLKLRAEPMIGVIGTAPRRKSILNGTPGEHGGNMDCTLIGSGSIVYLPVNVKGALLAAGDVHARMGDGEVVICGVECTARVKLRTKVLKKSMIPTPMVETKDSLAVIGSAKSLDKCQRICLSKMVSFLTDTAGISANEACRLMSIVGQLRVCQVVDPLKTMRFEFPKSVLKACSFSMRRLN